MRRIPLLLTIAPLLLGCADRGASGDDAATGGTVIIAVPGAFTPALPIHATTATTANIASQVYDRLATSPADLGSFGDAGFTPRLAERWTWAADSMSIAFHIDPDARWHDGRPVRANDVRFSFELSRDPKSGSAIAPLIANIDSISVRDSLTAVAHFRTRTPEQFYDLAYQLYIMPEHVLKDVPREGLATTDASKILVGSGRFKLAKFEPGARLELLSDTANYRGRAKLDRVIFTVAADGGAAIAQILSGQADVLEFIPPDMVARLDSGSPARAEPFPGLAYSYLGMNQRAGTAAHPIFSDRAVRRAISMALDRQAMLKNVFDTLGVLGSGPYARRVADTSIALPAFDRAAAGALLDSAGWRAGADGIRMKNGRPLQFSVMYPTSSKPRERYAVLIQEQLKSIGARVNLTAVDFPTFMRRQEAGEFDAALISANPDANLGGARQYWTATGAQKGGQNFVKYSNPAFDALLDSAIASFDGNRRRDQTHRAWQMLIDDAPGVWLYDLLFMNAVHRRLRTTNLRADGWWAGLADWTIPANERIDRDRIGLQPAQQ
jgi:peptide/nickel transport system substrate-binding protein